jgi:DNA-binding transcriptional MerR regulator
VCGVSPRTIDFYTNLGLLEPSGRSEGGHRFYGAEAPRWVRAIKALQADGLSLEEARDVLESGAQAVDVLPRAEQLRQELRRMEREVAELRPRLAALPPRAEARAATERAVQASMQCALGLAHELAGLLRES